MLSCGIAMKLKNTVLGEGPPVVLLHGLFGRSQNLASLAKRLSASFRTIALDLRNHGASPHAPGMAYADMAADVRETLEPLGALPAAMIGHSMGGKVAMCLALSRPDLVTRLLVADIAPVAYRHSNRAVARALLGLDLAAGLTRAQASAALTEAVPDQSVRAFLLQNLDFSEKPTWRIGLPEIAAGMGEIEGFPPFPEAARYPGPTLFVRGALSGYVKDSARDAIAPLFPAFRMETIEGAGHWLHAEQPEIFGSLAEAFLRSAG